MNKTSIEWVKNPDGSQGYTWNPITGCLNHVNGMCKGGGFPCYAYRLANGRLKQRYLANHKWTTEVVAHSIPAVIDPFYPRFWPPRLEELHDRNRAITERGLCPEARGIFVCDMGELFSDWVPEDWTREILHAIDLNEGHDRFYLLTKQPQNLIKWSPFPENCWVGVTVCNRPMLNAALYHLQHIKATVRYLSLEPLLDRLSDKEGRTGRVGPGAMIKGMFDYDEWVFQHVDWLIIGAQTKPYKPPKIEWVQEIVEAADKAGIPVFLKDNLLEAVNYESPETEFAFNKEGYYRQELPSALQLRQEVGK